MSQPISYRFEYVSDFHKAELVLSKVAKRQNLVAYDTIVHD